MRRDPRYEEAYRVGPLVTVRIGTCRRAALLIERAISSVQRQDYANWEAIVVCDGPDPETAERIANLGDARIRCVQRPRNGPYPADEWARWNVIGTHPFNEGHALARGTWIAPLDDDDEWTDDHLSVLVGTALRTRAEVVYGVGQTFVAGTGETYFGAWPPVLGDFGFGVAVYHALLSSFLYDANAHLFGEPADWNLARRMLEAGVRFEFVEQIVYRYYVTEQAPGLDWWRERVKTRGPFPLGC
jgi:glycosyltransferase involved in cell wall biosynthesis